MATLTAQILIGEPHPNHGGIEPSHYLFLSENSRPAWILVKENLIKENQDKSFRIVWIPTVENMLEDALLMIAFHVVKNPEIGDIAKNFNKDILSNRIELYTDLSDEQRNTLYHECRQLSDFPKVIISIFEGSHINNQITVLDNYKMDVEVCRSVYSRYYSLWKKKVVVTGALQNSVR